MELVSWRLAKSLGLKRYFTGKPCKYGHVSERHVSARGGSCLQCEADRYHNNPEPVKSRSRIWRATHPNEMRRQSKNRRPCNQEKKLARERKWRAVNPERAREMVRRWAKKNPAQRRRSAAFRRASKIQRTPTWADQEAIKMIYRAAEVAKVMWTDAEVDHIIPLNAKIVSGLHVPKNLQILPGRVNRAKGNSFFM